MSNVSRIRDLLLKGREVWLDPDDALQMATQLDFAGMYLPPQPSDTDEIPLVEPPPVKKGRHAS